MGALERVGRIIEAVRPFTNFGAAAEVVFGAAEGPDEGSLAFIDKSRAGKTERELVVAGGEGAQVISSAVRDQNGVIHTVVTEEGGSRFF